jgi:branched-chain amino acid transport system ATP-binding protein
LQASADLAGRAEDESMQTLLETEKLTKVFGGLAAVSNLDMVLHRGEILGLIGPNGSGKTTAINMISGNLRSTGGRILFNGQTITGLSPHLITRLGIARTYQQNILFNGMTVLQNVMMGLYASSKLRDWEDIIPTRLTRKKEAVVRERALGVLESLGLSDLRDFDVAQTPHGVKRLVGIAMALGNSPEIVLLDEPLSGMNAEEIDKTIGFIHELRRKGMTILIVEHHMGAIMRICDRLVVLNYGARIAEGSPEEIAENEDVIRAYLGSKHAFT